MKMFIVVQMIVSIEEVRGYFLDEEQMKERDKLFLDCIENLMGILDTPVGRMKLQGEFASEARMQARKILDDNGRERKF